MECNLYIFDFLFYGILPESVSILLIDGNNLLNCHMQLKPKLIGPLKVSRTAPFHHGNYSDPFLKEVWCPPVKGWLMVDALGYGIFSRVQPLKIG